MSEIPYHRLLEATRALHPAAPTPVRLVRAALSRSEPLWDSGADHTVLVVDGATDARLRRRLTRYHNPADPPLDRALRLLGVRLDVQLVVAGVLWTMRAGVSDPAAAVSDVPGQMSLLIGLADLLGEADLDRIVAAAGLAPSGAILPLAVYESGTQRAAVEPLLRAAAERLHEDPLELGRTLFSGAPLDVGLQRLAERLARTVAVDTEAPPGLATLMAALLDALMAPIAAAELLTALTRTGQPVREGLHSTTELSANHDRALYAEAGRLTVEGLGRVLAAPSASPRSRSAAESARLRRATGRPDATEPAAPSSMHELFTRTAAATAELLGGTCKALGVEVGGDLADHLAGAYAARSGLIELHSGVIGHLDDLIRTPRPPGERLVDRLAHCGRAALQARAAGAMLHEFIHATDVLEASVHRRGIPTHLAWHLPISEAIAELTGRALLAEVLERTGLASLDPHLLAVETTPAYPAQTRAFEPIVQQVADWRGVTLRDELVALRRAGGPEESMALLAGHVTSVFGLDGYGPRKLGFARGSIRDTIQDGMSALQDSLARGPEYPICGDPFGGLLVRQLRETVQRFAPGVDPRSNATAPPGPRAAAHNPPRRSEVGRGAPRDGTLDGALR